MRNRLVTSLLILACASFILAATPPNQNRRPGKTSAQASRQVDFVRDIEPIFRTSCYSCHGPDKQGSNLRLDNKQAAFAGGLSGQSIIPGKGVASPLYRRVAGLGDDAQMPLKGEKLSSTQVRLIRDWIDQGARWPDELSGGTPTAKKHWAYVKPVRLDPPRVQNESWIRNPIDNFILARLEKEGLQPSPEADKETLIRRASLDLTGLP